MSLAVPYAKTYKSFTNSKKTLQRTLGLWATHRIKVLPPQEVRTILTVDFRSTLTHVQKLILYFAKKDTTGLTANTFKGCFEISLIPVTFTKDCLRQNTNSKQYKSPAAEYRSVVYFPAIRNYRQRGGGEAEGSSATGTGQ